MVGEAALIWIDGHYSHAVTKSALLRPARVRVTTLYPRGDDRRAQCVNRRARGRRAGARRAAVRRRLARYARVDLVPAADGPVVLEVELTEPSLFLGYEPDAAGRLADAIAAAL